jgi:hypothetical protein
VIELSVVFYSLAIQTGPPDLQIAIMVNVLVAVNDYISKLLLNQYIEQYLKSVLLVCHESYNIKSKLLVDSFDIINGFPLDPTDFVHLEHAQNNSPSTNHGAHQCIAPFQT